MEQISEEEIQDVADFFKLFSDPTRLKILNFLDLNEEASVNQIASFLEMGQSAISQQLKVLRSSRLVKFRKNGRSIIYRLADNHIHSIIKIGFEHYSELFQ